MCLAASCCHTGNGTLLPTSDKNYNAQLMPSLVRLSIIRQLSPKAKQAKGLKHSILHLKTLMAVVRKSAVPKTGSWFRRNPSPSDGGKFSMSPGSTLGSISRLVDEPLAVSSKRQGRAVKKLSVSTTHPLPEVAKQRVSGVKTQSNKTNQKNQKVGEDNLPVMPNSGSGNFWLLHLYTSHRYSSVVTFLLVSATLFVYGWIVYSQQMWSQGYNRLQNLKLYERQLTTTNATLKNKMAEEAQEASGLVSPTPARTIFLPASPSFSSPATQPRTPINLKKQQNSTLPLGY